MGISAYANVLIAADDSVRAADVSEGDRVIEGLSGKARLVLNVWQGPAVGMFHIETLDGPGIDCTEDHRIYTDRGPMWANEVRVGAKLRTATGWTECSAAGRLAGDYMVYDIKLEPINFDEPWLIANGLVVGA
ncbi:MAG: hypothetical protein LUC93_12640 [Planctomycetaceae bacterium]|nr:hypothetical protein [Planctomycetaceae bacterium]